MNETKENIENNTDEELSAIKSYSFTPPENYYEKHDYQDERVCVGAIVMSFASMLLSFFTVYTIFNVSASTKYSCLFYPVLSLIATLTSVKILKKDKDLLAAKCSLGISIASLIITIGIAIIVAIYVGYGSNLVANP